MKHSLVYQLYGFLYEMMTINISFYTVQSYILIIHKICHKLFLTILFTPCFGVQKFILLNYLILSNNYINVSTFMFLWVYMCEDVVVFANIYVQIYVLMPEYGGHRRILNVFLCHFASFPWDRVSHQIWLGWLLQVCEILLYLSPIVLGSQICIWPYSAFMWVLEVWTWSSLLYSKYSYLLTVLCITISVHKEIKPRTLYLLTRQVFYHCVTFSISISLCFNGLKINKKRVWIGEN